MELTQAYLKSVMDYDPDTGSFTWLSRPRESFKRHRQFLTWNKRFSGKAAGSVDAHGYVRMGINGVRHKAHRLAFLYMTGAFPSSEIDHINGNRRDNRFSNLRAVTRSTNQKNVTLRQKNISGCVGVIWDKSKRAWVARITSNGNLYYLGSYQRVSDAIASRKAAEAIHGFHENHGRRRNAS